MPASFLKKDGKKKRKGQPKKGQARLFRVLDSFSVKEINEWQKFSESYLKYRFGLFSDLAHQRAKISKQLREAFLQSAFRDFKFENWQRIVPYEFSDDPLSIIGSMKVQNGGRFNYGLIDYEDEDLFHPFGSLYIANDRETAIFEKYGYAKDHSKNLTVLDRWLTSPDSISVVSVNGMIESYLDLTKASNLKLIAKILSEMEIPDDVKKAARELNLAVDQIVKNENQLRATLLHPDWKFVPTFDNIPANCQIFGHIAYQVGIEAILYPSTKGKGKCLAIFPQNFVKSSSFVELAGPLPENIKRRRLDSGECKTFSDPF